MPMTAAPPIAIPAMAPVESDDPELTAEADAEDDEEDEDEELLIIVVGFEPGAPAVWLPLPLPLLPALLPEFELPGAFVLVAPGPAVAVGFAPTAVAPY